MVKIYLKHRKYDALQIELKSGVLNIAGNVLPLANDH